MAETIQVRVRVTDAFPELQQELASIPSNERGRRLLAFALMGQRICSGGITILSGGAAAPIGPAAETPKPPTDRERREEMKKRALSSV